MNLKIDTEIERFELVFKGFEQPFKFQGETVSVIVGSGSR